MTYLKAINHDKRIGKNLFLVKNELFTIKEINKLNLKDSFIKDNFVKIELNKNKTYFFFGARFESKLK